MYCGRKFLSRWKFNFMQRLHLIKEQKTELINNTLFWFYKHNVLCGVAFLILLLLFLFFFLMLPIAFLAHPRLYFYFDNFMNAL